MILRSLLLLLSIQWFDDPAEALAPILSQRPQVVAFGEYHQSLKTLAVKSALRRFLDDILPRLQFWPSDLIVETWVPEGDCGGTEKAVVKDVKKTTQRPSKTEDEIVSLIRKSAEMGIKPHILEIACADYQALLGADGEVDYDRLLVLLARQILRTVQDVRRQRPDSERPILIYGGALHNDLYPRPETARYSFGPQLYQDVHGLYQEVDLYVPQYVEHDPTVTAEPWWNAYQMEARSPQTRHKTALIRRGPHSYVLLFPRN